MDINIPLPFPTDTESKQTVKAFIENIFSKRDPENRRVQYSTKEIEALIKNNRFTTGNLPFKPSTPNTTFTKDTDLRFVEPGIVTSAAFKTLGSTRGNTSTQTADFVSLPMYVAPFETNVPQQLRWEYRIFKKASETPAEYKKRQAEEEKSRPKTSKDFPVMYPIGYGDPSNPTYQNKRIAFADLLLRIWEASYPEAILEFATTKREQVGFLTQRNNTSIEAGALGLAKQEAADQTKLNHKTNYLASRFTKIDKRRVGESRFQPSWQIIEGTDPISRMHEGDVVRVLKGEFIPSDLKDPTHFENGEWRGAQQEYLQRLLHLMLFEHCVVITQLELIRRRAGGAANLNSAQKIKGKGKLTSQRVQRRDYSKQSSPNDTNSNWNPIPAMMSEEWEESINEVLEERLKEGTNTDSIGMLLDYLKGPVDSDGRKFPGGRKHIELQGSTERDAPVLLTKEDVGLVLISGM
jgi:hypothetical protein